LIVDETAKLVQNFNHLTYLYRRVEIVMALQSKLFAGNRQLEAAAVSDPAHIMQGAIGEHVRKIQTALITVDGASIAADGKFGAATAAAVLAFKRKRDIVNRSYQSQADAIVGKMTMAALDDEMAEAEKRIVIKSDSSYCRFGKPRLPRFSV
jgi:peptidoglycan hydrolase-like protein with peptidoglycan-binding domain